MKKIYAVLALIGIVFWSAAVLLRDTSLMNYEIIRRVLCVAPNFGVVWAGVGFTYLLFPHIFKREFSERHTVHLVGIIFAVLLVSEIVHHLFLNSPFDILDMLASAIASIVVILIRVVSKRSK